MARRCTEVIPALGGPEEIADFDGGDQPGGGALGKLSYGAPARNGALSIGSKCPGRYGRR